MRVTAVLADVIFQGLEEGWLGRVKVTETGKASTPHNGGERAAGVLSTLVGVI